MKAKGICYNTIIKLSLLKFRERRERMKGAVIMLSEEKKEAIKLKLPVTDPKYIEFKRLKGILGEIDTDKIREERKDEIITRYKCNT